MTADTLSSPRDSLVDLRHLADTMPQIVWISRADGYHEYFNRQWWDYTGLTFEQTRGEGWLHLLHPDDRQRTIDRWNHALQIGEPYEIEYRFRRASDGMYRWFLARALPQRDAKNRIVKWFGTCTDIHDKKVAEEQVKIASRQKDQFLAMLSHELRTPLTPTLLAVRDLQHDLQLPESAAESLKLIERNIELQTRLIDDLLDLTRIRTGKLHLQLASCDIHNVVEHALHVCQGDIDAKRLKAEIALHARQHFLRGDCARLHQVFWNLLKNAVKFTPEGGIIQVHSNDAGDGTIRICVQDSGIGIDPELLGRVFDAFEQGTEATARKLGGLGLGLAITKAITEAHHGTISAHSAGKGYGASFEVLLPEMHPTPVQNGVEASPAADGEPKQSLRILLVEDHADTRNMLQKLLERRGHIVLPAIDVSSAITVAKSTHIDLLLTDLSLPDGDGRTVLEYVRREEGRVGAVVMSGHGSEEAAQESLSAGFDEHLTKPVSLENLEAAIARVVSANDWRKQNGVA